MPKADASYCVGLATMPKHRPKPQASKEQGGFASAANLKDIYHNILN
jgi:hypothetical protein